MERLWRIFPDLTNRWISTELYVGGSLSEEMSADQDRRITVTFPHIIGRSRPYIRHPVDAQRWAASDPWRVRMKRRHQQQIVVSSNIVSDQVSARNDKCSRRNPTEISRIRVTRDGHFDIRVIRLVTLTYLQLKSNRRQTYAPQVIVTNGRTDGQPTMTIPRTNWK